MDQKIYEHWSDGDWQQRKFLEDLESLPADDAGQIKQALSFAKEKHAGQFRDDNGKYPYFIHVLRVGRVLFEEFGVKDLEILTAAMLHDTIEDCGVTKEYLARNFGERVADLVAQLSQNSFLSRHDYLSHIKDASKEVKTIKLADRLDNIRSMPKVLTVWPKQEVVAYIVETEKYLLPYASDFSKNLYGQYLEIISYTKNILAK